MNEPTRIVYHFIEWRVAFDRIRSTEGCWWQVRAYVEGDARQFLYTHCDAPSQATAASYLRSAKADREAVEMA